MAAQKPEKESRTYLEAISSFTPWGSRSATPKPVEKQSKEEEHEKKPPVEEPTSVQRGGDHKVSRRRPLSLKHYPRDCPKLDTQWFHAVDVPKRKADYVYTSAKEKDKPPPAPKKWVAFSKKDSKAIEAAFQSLPAEDDKPVVDDQEPKDIVDLTGGDHGIDSKKARSDEKHNRSIETANADGRPSTKVAVNEDYLFDVDVERRELGPAYWLGPVYEVRRGTWFYAEGTLRPCDENLATQLEEGYLKAKPWRTAEQLQRSKSQGRHIAESSSADLAKGHKANKSLDTTEAMRQTSSGHEQNHGERSSTSETPLTHRLFGPHSNWIVTYQGPATAYLLSDDFISRMSSTMFSRFVGAGTKVVRGYVDTAKKPAAKDKDAKSRSSSPDRQTDSASKRLSLPMQQQQTGKGEEELTAGEERAVEQESRLQALERQMSNLVTSAFADPAKQDEEERKREENEITEDYRDTPGDPQDREIEHLVLVTHGIGQRLGARFETFNFVHDVNELRKTLKAVYGASADLQALNDEVDKLPQNCRVQVLPVCWRHLLDFPKQSLKHNRKEHDLADTSSDDDDKYPSLQDITVEGVPALRNIVADLALDILLYQTPAYRDHIARIVAEESNRIYKLFKQRNPHFRGNVSYIGHSLGSAIMFDILCDQPREQPALNRIQRPQPISATNENVKLDFEVVNMFCLGSPIGLFSMLKGKTIAGRRNPNLVTLDGYAEGVDQSLQDSPSMFSSNPLVDGRLDALVSAPRCQSLYNMFHPSDPIAYRLEPLISPAMTSMKPQNLPYVKKSWLSAPSGQGIVAIPSRLGQSMSGLWSSMSSGLTDRFIHRTLGLTAEDAARLGEPVPTPAQIAARSQGAGTNIVAGGVISPHPPAPAAAAEGLKRKLTEETAAAVADGQNPPTLIDSELETLYSGFRKKQKSEASAEDPEEEERGRMMRREEAKIRALNSNGRVDYSIQEGAFDISFLAGIASHLSYWQDEDICHFMTSQLLSKQRPMRRSKSKRSTVG